MRRIPRLSAPVAFVIGVLAALTSLPSPALADDESDVTWSVQPADEAGVDGRKWIELTLDPGEQVTEHLALRNLSAIPVTFVISAADGYLTSTGRFNMLPSDRESVAAGTWVEAPPSIAVGPGATEIVPFTVSVPENATPGDHAAGIAASVESVGTGEGGNAVSIESRVGFPVMTRVTGELQPSLGIEPGSIGYDLSWNPFQPGRVTVTYRLVNDGNVRMQAKPTVSAQGQTSAADPDAPPMELLPGESREVTADVGGVWPLFFAPVQVSVEPMLVTPDGEAQSVEPLVAEYGVWVIPVPQLLVLAGVALIVVALLVGRRRSQRRVAALIAEAREEGRHERREE
jgi:hypothetical protein